MELWILGIIIVVLMILSSAIRIVNEYERGVIFRLGRLVGARGPGLFFIIPLLEVMIKVDLRTVAFDVPPQEVITKDNVTTRVNAVVYYRVMDPEKAVTQVEHYPLATSQMALTTLRGVIGQAELDELLSERDKLNKKIQETVDEATDPWGIKVSAVEIKDVELPKEMQRAMASQAEAERDRRARIISADGEKQASQKLAEAADILNKQEGGMFIRTLQTIAEASAEKATTVVIPLPIELLQALGYSKKEKK
ncbi:MAG: slipin family protein [Methanocellales archaeon]|nr:slipin family protein [Methanocellales archaeon]